MTLNHDSIVNNLREELAMYDRIPLNEDDDNVRNLRRETECLRKALRNFDDARAAVWG